ncbi:hypothetical protein AB0I54_42480 [Streptomyces sp. NPDC050625]|uniref:hypothetical protein n=1 Tax=Streptomyces sp. NPDC050625 TaxID=3154629 RepID=UPI0034173079
MTITVDTWVSDHYGDPHAEIHPHRPTAPPLDREAKRRLAVIRHIEEVTGNVAMSCHYQRTRIVW